MSCQRAPTPREFSDNESFVRGTYAATHNSYSGLFRSSIVDQLESGVRYLELDVHDDGFMDFGFRIGHHRPGHQVDTESPGNPSTIRLSDWLDVISLWSHSNPGHSALMVAIDLKTSLLDRDGASFSDLEDHFVSLFGPRLVQAREVKDVWPTIGELRDRVIPILSGHEETRLHYFRESGIHPSIAIDAVGNVVVALEQERGVWIWTGQFAPEFTFRHRVFVGVGQNPVVEIDDSGGLRLRYEQEEGGAPLYLFGSLDEVGVQWHSKKTDALDAIEGEWFPHQANKNRAEKGSAWVEIRSAGQDELGENVLWLTSSLQPKPVLLQRTQVFFNEKQYGDDAAFTVIDPWFVGASAKGESRRKWAAEQRERGRIARLWQTNRFEQWTLPSVHLPATDYPQAHWYRSACYVAGCVR